MQLSSSKTIAKNTLFLYLRMALSMIVSLYTVRAVVNILGIEDYGLYNAIGGVVTSMSFLTAVLANASQRYFAIEIGKGKDGDINRYFNSIFIAYVIISIVIFVAIESMGVYLLNNIMTIPDGRMAASNIVLQVSLLTFFISILGTPFFAIVIASERMNVYAFISIFESLAKLGVVYLLYKSPFDNLVFYAFLLMTVALFINIIYCYYACKTVELKLVLRMDILTLKELFSYTGWTLFGTLSGVASTQGISVLLNIFSGPVANTAYAISNQVGSTVQMFASSFFTAVRPPLTKSYSAHDYNYMNKLFNFSNKAIFVLTYAIIFPLLIKTEFIMKMWLGQVSPFLVDFVRAMLIYAFLISLSNPITTIVQAAGKVKMYHTVVDGFALLILPLIYILLKLGMEVKYTICITIIVFGIAHIFRLLVLKRVVEFSIIRYFVGFILPSLIVSVLSLGLYKIFYSQFINDTMSNIMVMCIAAISVLVLSFIFLLTREEKTIICELIRRK